MTSKLNLQSWYYLQWKPGKDMTARQGRGENEVKEEKEEKEKQKEG